MACKKIGYGISFADIAIKAYSDKNRNLLFLREVENTIDWQPVQDLLMEHYEPGKSKTGEQAYPPLLLFKCLLLQKWFRIMFRQFAFNLKKGAKILYVTPVKMDSCARILKSGKNSLNRRQN